MLLDVILPISSFSLYVLTLLVALRCSTFVLNLMILFPFSDLLELGQYYVNRVTLAYVLRLSTWVFDSSCLHSFPSLPSVMCSFCITPSLPYLTPLIRWFSFEVWTGIVWSVHIVGSGQKKKQGAMSADKVEKGLMGKIVWSQFTYKMMEGVSESEWAGRVQQVSARHLREASLLELGEELEKKISSQFFCQGPFLYS